FRDGSLPALLVSRKGAKTQSQDKMFTFPALHLGAFAPLREVKSWNRQAIESRQSGMFSSCLPVSLSPFHHPSFALPETLHQPSFPQLGHSWPTSGGIW
ncbi:MAG: hypothetical protein ACK56U_04595, partial [Planctomyces sp.]